MMWSLLILLQVAFATSSLRNQNVIDILYENMPEYSKVRISPPDVKYFNQKMDHFDATNEKTWEQQYYVDASKWQVGNPVFLYMGGEGDLNERTFTFAWCAEYAVQFGALCFGLEHRFYGDSWPVHQPTTEDLKLLSASQALEDASNFINAMTEEYNLPEGTKWVTYGGSYPGSLAAWMRLKYPEQIFGAISTSGPLIAQADFREYMLVVKNAIDKVDPKCMPVIDEVSHTLKAMQLNETSQPILCELFDYCGPYDDESFSSFYVYVMEVFQGAAQYNNFLSNDPSRNLKLVCEIMTNKDLGDPILRLRELLSFVKKNAKEDQEEEFWWDNQVCDEFGWFQTSYEFGNEFIPIDFIERFYCNRFGPEFTADYIEGQIAKSNELFGGLDPGMNIGVEYTNVVFVHGTIDPWSAMGRTLPYPNDSVDVLIIEDGSHCQNMYPNIEEGWPNPTMSEAKATIRQRLAEWLL